MRRLLLILVVVIFSSPLFADNVMFGLSEADKHLSSLSEGKYDMAFAESFFDFEASYQNRMPSSTNMKLFNAGLGLKFGTIALSASGSYLPGMTYKLSSNKDFTPLDIYLKFAASYLVFDKLAFTINAKYYTTKLDPNVSYNGIGFGLSGAYIFDNFTFGLGVQNLGPKVKSISGLMFNLPTAGFLNASYARNFGKIGINSNLEAKYFFVGAIAAKLQVCGNYNELVFLSMSYNYGSNNAPIPSYANLGLALKMFGIKLSCNFYFASELLHNTLTISIGYSF